MKYTVVWSKIAEQLLAEFWMRAFDRDAVTQAAREIDRELQNRPFDIGESREAGRRVYFTALLGVAYSVRPDDMLVRVMRVWEIKGRGR